MKTVILISGKMQSGKNVVGSIIEKEIKYINKTSKHLFFAKPLKDACKNDFQKVKEYFNSFVSDIIEKYNYVVPNELFKDINKLLIEDENFYENKTELTRILLQIYGTEIFRNRVDENYWVDKLSNEIKNGKDDYYIITDVRFPNEIDYLKQSLVSDYQRYKIVTIRVERPLERNNIIHEHPSESALDSYNFDYIINNSKSIDELELNAINLFTLVK